MESLRLLSVSASAAGSVRATADSHSRRMESFRNVRADARRGKEWYVKRSSVKSSVDINAPYARFQCWIILMYVTADFEIACTRALFGVVAAVCCSSSGVVELQTKRESIPYLRLVYGDYPS